MHSWQLDERLFPPSEGSRDTRDILGLVGALPMPPLTRSAFTPLNRDKIALAIELSCSVGDIVGLRATTGT